MSNRRLEIGMLPTVASVYPVVPVVPSDEDDRTINVAESEFYKGGELILSGLRDLGPDHLRTAVGVTSLAYLLTHATTRSGVLLPNGSDIVAPTSEFNRLIGRHPYKANDR